MHTRTFALMIGLLGVLALPLAAAAGSGGNGTSKGDNNSTAVGGPDCLTPTQTVSPQTIVGDWNCAALVEVRASRSLRNGPPIVARALAITHTCMYDAWAAYDSAAVGTVLGAGLRRPAAERTTPNK